MLERRACLLVRAVLGRRDAGGKADDGPVGDVAVHALRVERALGHIKEDDVGVRRGLLAVSVRVSTQAAVGDAAADTVLRHADGECGAAFLGNSPGILPSPVFCQETDRFLHFQPQRHRHK